MKIFQHIAWLILFTLVGAIIAALYADASITGKFEKWQPMGTPPDGAVKIVAIDYVETQSGLLYHFEYTSDCTNGCWVQAETVPTDADIGQPLDQAKCLRNSHPSVKNFVDSRALCYYPAPQIFLYVIAVDKNGYVYFWRHGVGEDIWFFVAPFWGGAAGFIIGLIIVLLRLSLIELVQEKAAKRNDLQG